MEIPYGKSGQLDRDALLQAVDDRTAAVLVQSPNFFGVIEDIAAIESAVHKKGALLVSGFTEATSLGILKPAVKWVQILSWAKGRASEIP